MTGAQVREARRLLGWTRVRLSGWSGVSATAIQMFEDTGCISTSPYKADSPISVQRLAQIRAAFETAGVEFIAKNGGGPGVRLAKMAERQ